MQKHQEKNRRQEDMDSGKKTINHVEIRKILPVQDGYRMPGEYEPHRGCILIWPERPGEMVHGRQKKHLQT
mgnify:FL=1